MLTFPVNKIISFDRANFQLQSMIFYVDSRIGYIFSLAEILQNVEMPNDDENVKL